MSRGGPELWALKGGGEGMAMSNWALFKLIEDWGQYHLYAIQEGEWIGSWRLLGYLYLQWE